jgi:hypothetical protein
MKFEGIYTPVITPYLQNCSIDRDPFCAVIESLVASGSDITTPFGGFKSSGFGGRDNGVHADDQYTQIKTIWVDLADVGDEGVA